MMTNPCNMCDKWKAKQEQVLMTCESIFDVEIDMIMFEKVCAKTCPYRKKDTENS